MEILEKPDHKIGTKIRGLATVLGAVAAGDGRTWPACVAIDGIGDLRYPESTQPDSTIIP